jgi:inorganic pyrophosphatase
MERHPQAHPWHDLSPGGRAPDEITVVVETPADLPQHVLREIDYFFSTYKALEGKTVVTRAWDDAALAKQEIARSIELYRTRYG